MTDAEVKLCDELEDTMRALFAKHNVVPWWDGVQWLLRGPDVEVSLCDVLCEIRGKESGA
jgi:hypothetical protein